MNRCTFAYPTDSEFHHGGPILAAIFISYRREDSEDSTRAIYESLRPEFGKERLFMDVEAIALGSDFRDAVERSLAGCGVFLAVIGPTWLNVKSSNDPNAPRRLDNPNDYVRQEVAAALKKGKQLPVIPVLVRGASMPTSDQLPDDLKDLAYRNALTLSNLDWDSSVAKLTEAIRPRVGEPQAVASVASREVRSVARPSTFPSGATTAPASGTNKVLLIGIPVVLVLAAVGVYFGLRPKPTPQPMPGPQTHVQTETVQQPQAPQQSQPQPSPTLAPKTQSVSTPASQPNKSPEPQSNQPTLEAKLVRNPRLKGLTGPVDVFIDGKQIGQIQSNPNGSTPLEFHVAAGEHSFKFVDPKRHSTCDGTFSVSSGQSHFKPAITSGGTQCLLDPAFQN